MSEVEISAECTKAILELVSNEEVKERFSSRARAFLTETFSLGPAHVISIAAARSNSDAVEAGLKFDGCREVVKYVVERKLRAEDASYALYGSILLYALKKRGYVKSTNLADAILELERVPSALVYKYADWIKRFAEAYFRR